MKHSNLYLVLVLPSGGWQSLIGQIVFGQMSWSHLKRERSEIFEQKLIEISTFLSLLFFIAFLHIFAPDKMYVFEAFWSNVMKLFTSIIYEFS